jgi:hypothetical protein
MDLEEQTKTTPDVGSEPIDPVVLISDFIEKYELIIRPNLKEGEVFLVTPAIGDCCLRFGLVEKDNSVSYPHPRVYAAYRMALTYLQGFLDPRAISSMKKESFRESYLNSLDRQVSELDIAMGGLIGERWKEERKKWQSAL